MNIDEKIKEIIFDDEFAILGKIKFNNNEAIGPQIDKFKIQALKVLIGEVIEEVIPKTKISQREIAMSGGSNLWEQLTDEQRMGWNQAIKSMRDRAKEILK